VVAGVDDGVNSEASLGKKRWRPDEAMTVLVVDVRECAPMPFAMMA
jgi:hypothetical protein